MKKLYDTPIKSIRKKCLDCSGFQPGEVRKCTIISCPLYPYRFGRRPDEDTLTRLKRFFMKKVKPTRQF